MNLGTFLKFIVLYYFYWKVCYLLGRFRLALRAFLNYYLRIVTPNCSLIGNSEKLS